MPRHAPGTAIDPKHPYGAYTVQQLTALERLKDRKYSKGVAGDEYVGKLLLPDGSLSDDVAGMIDATKAQLTELLTGDTSDPKVLDAAKRAAERVREVVDHVGQGRFLFVVDADGLPVVYFQCAVDGNPDLPDELPDDRDALEDRAWEIAEVQEHIAAVTAAAKGGR